MSRPLCSSRPGRSAALGAAPLALVLLAVALLATAGCESNDPAGCGDDQACPEGQVCELGTSRCVAKPAPSALPELGRAASIACAVDGTVWVASQAAEDPPALAVGTLRRGQDLQVELLWQGPGIAEGTSLALLPGSPARPLVAFHDAGRGRLLLAEQTEVGWSLEEVDDGGDGPTGAHPSLTLDDSGQPWVAYQDGRGNLRVAHRDGARWSHQTADEPGDGEGPYGLYASLVLVRGQPWVAHYDAGGGNLRVSRWDGERWRSTVIAGEDPASGADTGDLGRFASAALDPLGNAAVAFYDATRGALVLAENDQGVLRLERIDDGNDGDGASLLRPHRLVGQHASLAFGRGGQPRIAYLDGGELDLVLAVREDGRWSRRVLVGAGVAGLGAVQTVDGEGGSVVAHSRLVDSPDAPSGRRRVFEVLWP